LSEFAFVSPKSALLMGALRYVLRSVGDSSALSPISSRRELHDNLWARGDGRRGGHHDHATGNREATRLLISN